MKRVHLFLTLSLAFIFLIASPSFAQQGEGLIKILFSKASPKQYQFLVAGEEQTTIKLLWDNGDEEVVTLSKGSTPLKGDRKSESLQILGTITLLECSGNGIKELDVSQMPSLTHLISRKNLHRELLLTSNKDIRFLLIQDSALEQLDLSSCLAIDTVVVNNNRLHAISFPQAEFALTFLNCAANPKLTELDLSFAKRLKHLEAIQTLVQRYNLSENKQLVEVSIGLGKPIQELILPANNHIERLQLPMAGLKKLDLSQTRKLKELVTDNNFALQALDLTGQSNLEVLQCENNQLTTLDLSQTPKLRTLICNNNQLASLDFAATTQIETVVCHSNTLSRLDFSLCRALQELDCSYNPELEELLLPKSLTGLNCSNASLSHLETAHLTSLATLDCSYNQLTTLGVSPLVELTLLNVSHNPINQVAIEPLTKLLDVNINNTQIAALDLSNAKDLRYLSINAAPMDACALDRLYTSLRSKRAEDDESDYGGLTLFNNVPTYAQQSKTSIATDKGWMVSTVGDGTGCKETIYQNSYTVNVSNPGSLWDDIPGEVFETAEALKIIGEINSTDLRTVRQFCGGKENGYPAAQKLKKIDLSEVTFVKGGLYYIATNENDGSVKEYRIEDTDKLPDKLFYNCVSIQEIVLPKSILAIGKGAFFNCYKLKKITIPESVKRIESTAFGVCQSLEQITLPKQLEELGGYAFTHCKMLREVTIPEGVKKLYRRSFDETPLLTTINLPQTMEWLDDEAFLGASGVKSLTLPEGIVDTGNFAFKQCYSLETIKLPSSIRRIGTNAFQNCEKLREVNFPEGLEVIEEMAFSQCNEIKEIQFPSTLTKVGKAAFDRCKGIAKLHLGGVKEIGELAFRGCDALTTLAIPRETNRIDYAAFAECGSLQEVDLSLSTPTLVQNPFLGCTELKGFVKDEANDHFFVDKGVLYSGDRSKLLAFPNKATKDYTIIEGCQTTEDFAFWFATNLEAIAFPESLTSLGWRAFTGSSALKQVKVATNEPIENNEVEDPFEEVDVAKCLLLVPAGSEERWGASPLWGRFMIKGYTDATFVAPSEVAIAYDPVRREVAIHSHMPEVWVALYSLEGLCIASSYTDKEGICHLPLAAVLEGVYIIQLGDESYKLLLAE